MSRAEASRGMRQAIDLAVRSAPTPGLTSLPRHPSETIADLFDQCIKPDRFVSVALSAGGSDYEWLDRGAATERRQEIERRMLRGFEVLLIVQEASEALVAWLEDRGYEVRARVVVAPAGEGDVLDAPLAGPLLQGALYDPRWGADQAGLLVCHDADPIYIIQAETDHRVWRAS